MAIKEEKIQSTGFFARPSRILFAISFILAIVLAVAELGLVSQQLQNGGNDSGNYPGREFKYNLGEADSILLFTIILTLIISLTHNRISMKLIAFGVFILAVFWGTGAGIIFQVSPFHVYSCKFDVNTFEPIWQPFYSQCSRIVAIEAIAWAEFGLMILILIQYFVDAVHFSIHKDSFYEKSPEELQIIEKQKQNSV
ncbi:hypothetical protein P7C70_g1640, partial [Phenoliferia sp. Uapishka_3]